MAVPTTLATIRGARRSPISSPSICSNGSGSAASSASARCTSSAYEWLPNLSSGAGGLLPGLQIPVSSSSSSIPRARADHASLLINLRLRRGIVMSAVSESASKRSSSSTRPYARTACTSRSITSASGVSSNVVGSAASVLSWPMSSRPSSEFRRAGPSASVAVSASTVVLGRASGCPSTSGAESSSTGSARYATSGGHLGRTP